MAARRLLPVAGVLGAAVAAALVPQSGSASGDMGCRPDWTVEAPGRDCADRGAIAPGNDTRVNLLFLMRDRDADRSDAAGRVTPAYPPADAMTEPGYGHIFFDWKLARVAYYGAPVVVPGGEDQPEFYGTRCASLATADTAFAAALAADRKVRSAERDALVAARGRLAQTCRGSAAASRSGYGTAPPSVPPAPAPWPDDVASPPARDFLAYLKAADAFYAERFAEADAGFAALRGAADPWVAETATYMLIRTGLAGAQATAFDEWGSFAGAATVDRAALARGSGAIAAYLKAYPRGRYGASAVGLLRRAAWLGGDEPALARLYGATLGRPGAIGDMAPDLAEEIDVKLLFPPDAPADAPTPPAPADAPLLLATLDLVRMRGPDRADPLATATGLAPPTAAEIAGQRGAFGRNEALFGFVQAAQAFYVARDYPRVLSLIPADPRPAGHIGFSRQVLRGLALEKQRAPAATAFWQGLATGSQDLYQRPLIELALAMNYERAGRVADVFARGSAVTEVPIRLVLLSRSADAGLLRAVAGRFDRPPLERQVALFVLLTKELSRGRYADFVADVAAVPADAETDGWVWDWSLDQASTAPTGAFVRGPVSDGFDCPALVDTARTLSRQPANATARLCLADFWRLNGLDHIVGDEDRPGPDALGGVADMFGGRPLTRAPIYAAIIADPRATPQTRAYALYRAVNCYAPGGNNACGGTEAPVAQRRAWFQALKRDYPTSPWATSLKYYW